MTGNPMTTIDDKLTENKLKTFENRSKSELPSIQDKYKTYRGPMYDLKSNVLSNSPSRSKESMFEVIKSH